MGDLMGLVRCDVLTYAGMSKLVAQYILPTSEGLARYCGLISSSQAMSGILVMVVVIAAVGVVV